MKIYLVDHKKQMVDYWTVAFYGVADVVPVEGDFKEFMDSHEVDCVVSPANSYGLMDGGFDYAISEWFGWDLMDKVQAYIMEHYKGEQPVPSSFIIDTGVKNIKLIHTPTMRVPCDIVDSMVVYHAMRTTLMVAIENNIQSIVIPAFGGATGAVELRVIAALMREAYDQIMNPPKALDWGYANARDLEGRYR